MEDFEIVELYWDRNEDAIYYTDQKYNRYCNSIAYNILFNAEDSRECVNDTWLKAWDSMPPNRPENLATYLGKITRNLALNLYEKLTAMKRGGKQLDVPLEELSEVIGEESNVSKYIDQKVLSDCINRFLKTLDKDTRKAFVRRSWYLDSVKDVARMFSLKENNVKVMLFRTREKLREFLIREGYEL